MISKQSLISKFMTSSNGKLIITIQILPNVSRSGGIKTMKFGQLIESNMRNVFLEKSNQRRGGETSLKKQTLF